MEKPSKHFAYDHHVAKEVASVLHENSISCIDADNKKMQLRLQFYGVDKCSQYHLNSAYDAEAVPVTIRYNGISVYERYVSKVPMG